MKYFQKQPHTQKKKCSKAAAQIFTVAAHTLREEF